MFSLEVTSGRVLAKLSAMQSKLGKQVEEAMIEDARRLTPEQRLEAFAEHSRLMMELYLAGQRLRAKQGGGSG